MSFRIKSCDNCGQKLKEDINKCPYCNSINFIPYMNTVLSCPYCDSIIGSEDHFCPNCGSNLSISTNNELKRSISLLLDKATQIDNYNFHNKNNAPLIHDFKSKNNIKYHLIGDLIDWLFYLGLSDGTIADEEVDFINDYLNLNFTKEELLKIINKQLDDNYLSNLPLSFMLFHENELFQKNLNNESHNANDLLNVYKIIGNLFIHCDGQVTDDEIVAYNAYIDNLIKNFDNFKEMGYDLLIKTIPDTKNQVKTNLNKSNKKTQINKNNETDELKLRSCCNIEDENNPNITISDCDESSLEDTLESLNNLIGLDKVKEDVNSLINLIQIRKIREERGMKQPPMSLHLVFSGNPGTGKTTVARLLAKIYHHIGLLSKGHLVETDRSGLVGAYIGHTALKTKKVIKEAMGGILFIDEAYALNPSDFKDFGSEAIDTLLKAMEDNRDDLIIIVAGYPDLMNKFLNSNPGLKSRFNKFIYFEDYKPEDLYLIFKKLCDESDIKLDQESDQYLKEYCRKLYSNRETNFANGRIMRNLFEKVLSNQANRLSSHANLSNEELNTFVYADFK